MKGRGKITLPIVGIKITYCYRIQDARSFPETVCFFSGIGIHDCDAGFLAAIWNCPCHNFISHCFHGLVIAFVR